MKIHLFKRNDSKPISFKVSSPLKTLYRKGKLKLERGIYDGEISADTFSQEHIIPKSKGGTDSIGNLAISNRFKNSARGNKPLATVFNPEAFEKYCKTIEDQRLPELKGYILKLRKTVYEALAKGL